MLDATIILQILWTSLATSSYYVLFAVAFALVLKVTRLFNFAQAAIMTVAFYTAFVAVQWLIWPVWAAFAGMMAVTLAASYLLERIGFEALRKRGVSVMFVFVFTLMVSEFVAYVAMLIFGTWPQTIFPTIFWPATLIGNIAISAWDLPAIAATLGSLAALFVFMRFTRVGQFMVGVADNPDLAELYGINKRQIFLVAMLIAGAFSALGMFLYGTRAQVLPQTGLSLMLSPLPPPSWAASAISRVPRSQL
jgi:branched-subunit amino acid ABC-type transport system permease component